MLVPLAPSQRRAHRRAGWRTRGRRAARWAIGVLLIAGPLLAIGTPALAATHPASHRQTTETTETATQTTQTTQRTTRATGTTQARLTAMVTPAAPGGVCQVPGIGDIGGLIGLCSAGSSGIIGDLNNICEPSLPEPEQATGGIDAMVEPPASAAGGKTLYDNYGIAGQFWAAHGLQCSDMTSLIGNNVAGMVFDAAEAIDRVTITVYQSAAGSNILTWLQNVVDKLISALGKAIYFTYLAPVVILGAIWLAWQGLIRKRATRTIEGTLWMVVAATAAIALIGQPADFTGVGTTVSNGVTQVLNTAFAKLPAPANSNCLPVAAGDPQSVPDDYAFTTGNGLVDENANELWSVLVCKPWLYGELGTTAYNTPGSGPQTIVNTYGRQLLWAQAIAANETPSTALIQAKQATYSGIANSIQTNDPAIYPLFQGNQWTTRLEIAFAAMFAALVAGLLILLIALTLIVLKLGFLLLLVVGPLFLLVGTHPGFGRIIAIRWFEMLVGVLLKQVAIAVVLSVLLYCYSLIMGTSDAVLPWALKILMIALVTVAVFIYRKPFTHLFSAVGYGTLGSTERAEVSLREAGSTFRRNTLEAATVAIPGVAGYRAARWARRNPGQAAAVAAGAATGAGAGTGAAAAAAAGDATAGSGTGQAAAGDAYASRLRPDAPPAADGDGETSSGPGGIGRRGVAASLGRNRSMPEAEGAGRTAAPPLDLPPRNGNGGSATGGSVNGGSVNGGSASGTGASGGGAPASAASGWSRGSGRATSSGAGSGSARPAPPITASGNGSARGRGNTNAGSGSPQHASAWPSAGWFGASGTAGAGTSAGAGPRQRSAVERRPSEPASGGAAPGGSASGSAGGPGEPRPKGPKGPMPFWLRPVRRDK
jgi:TrbL/VirB6 plasmid conjugal transfer protein